MSISMDRGDAAEWTDATDPVDTIPQDDQLPPRLPERRHRTRRPVQITSEESADSLTSQINCWCDSDSESERGPSTRSTASSYSKSIKSTSSQVEVDARDQVVECSLLLPSETDDSAYGCANSVFLPRSQRSVDVGCSCDMTSNSSSEATMRTVIHTEDKECNCDLKETSQGLLTDDVEIVFECSEGRTGTATKNDFLLTDVADSSAYSTPTTFTKSEPSSKWGDPSMTTIGPVSASTPLAANHLGTTEIFCSIIDIESGPFLQEFCSQQASPYCAAGRIRIVDVAELPTQTDRDVFERSSQTALVNSTASEASTDASESAHADIACQSLYWSQDVRSIGCQEERQRPPSSSNTSLRVRIDQEVSTDDVEMREVCVNSLDLASEWETTVAEIQANLSKVRRPHAPARQRRSAKQGKLNVIHEDEHHGLHRERPSEDAATQVCNFQVSANVQTIHQLSTMQSAYQEPQKESLDFMDQFPEHDTRLLDAESCFAHFEPEVEKHDQNLQTVTKTTKEKSSNADLSKPNRNVPTQIFINQRQQEIQTPNMLVEICCSHGDTAEDTNSDQSTSCQVPFELSQLNNFLERSQTEISTSSEWGNLSMQEYLQQMNTPDGSTTPSNWQDGEGAATIFAESSVQVDKQYSREQTKLIQRFFQEIRYKRAIADTQTLSTKSPNESEEEDITIKHKSKQYESFGIQCQGSYASRATQSSNFISYYQSHNPLINFGTSYLASREQLCCCDVSLQVNGRRHHHNHHHHQAMNEESSHWVGGERADSWSRRPRMRTINFYSTVKYRNIDVTVQTELRSRKRNICSFVDIMPMSRDAAIDAQLLSQRAGRSKERERHVPTSNAMTQIGVLCEDVAAQTPKSTRKSLAKSMALKEEDEAAAAAATTGGSTPTRRKSQRSSEDQSTKNLLERGLSPIMSDLNQLARETDRYMALSEYERDSDVPVSLRRQGSQYLRRSAMIDEAPVPLELQSINYLLN